MGIEGTNSDLTELPKDNDNLIDVDHFNQSSDLQEKVRDMEGADTDGVADDLLMALEEPSTQEEALNLMYNRYKTETDQKKLENFVLNNKSGYTGDIGLDSTDASYLYFRDLSPAQQRDLGNTYYAKVLFSEFSDYLDDETGLQFVKNFINGTNGSYQIAGISDELTFKNLTVQDQNSLEELLKRASKRFQSKVD